MTNPYADAQDLNEGQRVRFVKSNGKLTGTGTIELIWLGIEVMIDIKVDGLGDCIALSRSIGDVIEPVEVQS